MERDYEKMAECPVITVTCDKCDYRIARAVDPTARLMCQLCENWDGETE